MQERKKKALIIGCGLAGSTLALFLQRAGMEAEIYETRTAPEGYALNLASNGLAILRMLGLDKAAFAEGSPISNSIMWNGKNRRLASMPLAGVKEKGIFIKRVPLGLLLSGEAERQGIKIALGKKLQNIAVDNQDRVIATFQDGTQATGDLLIGCDGVHSRTRQYVDPTFPGATYTGLMNAGGYTSSLKLAPTTETFHFIFGRQAFFGYHVSSSGEISWFVNYTQEEEPVRDATAKQTVDEQRQRLLTLFRDEQPLMRNIIQGAETIFPDFPTYILPKQPAWHRGPVGLIGDAAHAISSSSGQGASMALEDAAMLAKCLRDIPEIEQAFATFEQLRRERTQKMLDLGLRGDAGKHVVGPVQAWWRDLMTSFFLNLFATPKAVNWMYDYKVDWDAPLMGGSTFAGSVKEPAAEPDVIRQ